jgi:hypothetical protein
LETAEDIAKLLHCRQGSLTKWSKNPIYRRNGTFEDALKNCLPGRAVYVRVISAQADMIRASYPHIIGELGLDGLVKKFLKNNKPYLRFGPFQRVKILGAGGELNRQSEPAEFEIAERQAVYLIFICHYLLRMHRQLTTIMRQQRPALEWIDWQLMPDKFPGDIAGPMASLFHAIMSGAAHQRLVAGNMRIATFNNSNDDIGGGLADNIAGLFAGKLEIDDKDSAQSSFGASAMDYLIDWEIWRRDAGANSAARL